AASTGGGRPRCAGSPRSTASTSGGWRPIARCPMRCSSRRSSSRGSRTSPSTTASRRVSCRQVSFAGFVLKIALPVALIAAIRTLGPQDAALQIVLIGSVVLLVAAALLFGRERKPLPVFVPRRADSDEAVIGSLGIEVDRGDLRAACARVARRIHGDRIRVIGFVPADDQVAVPPVLIQLGIALTELSGATIAVVDANVRYPGLGALNEGKQPDSDDSVFS